MITPVGHRTQVAVPDLETQHTSGLVLANLPGAISLWSLGLEAGFA